MTAPTRKITTKTFNKKTGDTKTIVRQPKVSRKDLTAGEIRKIGNKANELKAAGASIEERMEAAQEMAQEILANPERQKKVETAKNLYNNGMSFKDIAAAIEVSESTARKYVANHDEDITLHSLSSLTLRIRECKREGLSNVAIGKRVGVSESTVRRRLKTPLTEEEILLESMMDLLEDARDELLERITEDPMFDRVFGTDRGEGWILRVNTIKRRAGFTRREGKGNRMTFTLEFAAYRQPVPKSDGD